MFYTWRTTAIHITVKIHDLKTNSGIRTKKKVTVLNVDVVIVHVLPSGLLKDEDK